MTKKVTHEIVLGPSSANGPVPVSCAGCDWPGLVGTRQQAHDWFGRHLLVARRRAPAGYDIPGPDDLQFTPKAMRDDLARRREERTGRQ